MFASEALQTAGIVPPTHLLTSDDVSRGKPDPEPYLKGAAMLSKDIKNCLVVEDAPAGIASGLAAGAKVVALCTSHKREQIEKLGAHYVIDNLDSLHVSWTQDNKIEITLS